MLACVNARLCCLVYNVKKYSFSNYTVFVDFWDITRLKLLVLNFLAGSLTWFSENPSKILQTICLVKKKNVSWIVLLSSKGAKTFQTNAKKAFNKEELSCINIACISSNVAKKLNKKYFKTFYPETPNINFIKKIISQCEKKYGA